MFKKSIVILQVCFLFLLLSSNTVSLNRDKNTFKYSFRMVRRGEKNTAIPHEERITVISPYGKEVESKIKIGTFPDGEFNVKIVNPEKVKGAKIDYSHSLKSANDFVEMLLTLGTLKQYGVNRISLKIKDWEYKISSREDRYLIQMLKLFSEEVNVAQNGGTISLPKPPNVDRRAKSFYVEKINYIQERFQEEAEAAAERLTKAEVSVNKINVEGTGDGHWEVRLPDYNKEDDVALIHSTENSENIVKLLLTMFALREANNNEGVRTVSLINTYQGYARQDKEFESGQGISAHTVVKTLNRFLDYNFPINVHYGDKEGITKLSSGEVYIEEDGEKEIVNELKISGRDLRVNNLNAFVQLAEGVVDRIIEETSKEEFINHIKEYPLILIGPDKGSFPYVRLAKDIVGARLKREYDIKGNIDVVKSGYLEKVRKSPTDTEIKKMEILNEKGELSIDKNNIENYWMAILDDETSTGGTLKKAVFHLSEKLGVDENKIVAGVVHGKFVEGIEEFFKMGENEMIPAYLLITDTLVPQIKEDKMGVVSIDHLITHAIKRKISSPPKP